MNKKNNLFLLAVLISTIINAQNRCGTELYTQILMQKEHRYAENKKNVNIETYQGE